MTVPFWLLLRVPKFSARGTPMRQASRPLDVGAFTACQAAVPGGAPPGWSVVKGQGGCQALYLEVGSAHEAAQGAPCPECWFYEEMFPRHPGSPPTPGSSPFSLQDRGAHLRVWPSSFLSAVLHCRSLRAAGRPRIPAWRLCLSLASSPLKVPRPRCVRPGWCVGACRGSFATWPLPWSGPARTPGGSFWRPQVSGGHQDSASAPSS